MTTVLLDSHVAYWWSAEPQRLSMAASQAIEHADELAVAAISWFELAWLAEQERIQLAIPVLSWLQQPSTFAPSVSRPRSPPRRWRCPRRSPAIRPTG